MDSFNEYENASLLEKKSQASTVDPPQVPDKAAQAMITSGSPSDKPSTVLIQDDNRKVDDNETSIHFESPKNTRPSPDSFNPPLDMNANDDRTEAFTELWKNPKTRPWLIYILIFMVALIIGWLLKGELNASFIKATESEQNFFDKKKEEIRRLKDENSQQENVIKKLRGKVTWLRYLLRREKENRATDKAIYEQKLSVAGQYQAFLREALKQFYQTPFRPDEGQRTICFTTNTNEQKCYQIVNPAQAETAKYKSPLLRGPRL